MKLYKALEHQRVIWCDQIISGLHFFLYDNWIYPLFHAVLFEAVPLQTDAVSSATVPSLEPFSDDLCLLFASAHCDCSWITMITILLPFDANLSFPLVITFKRKCRSLWTFPEGSDIQQRLSYAQSTDEAWILLQSIKSSGLISKGFRKT